jgi:hypothetical protein
MTRVATWRSSPLELLRDCAPAGFFLRTSLASLAPAKDGTLEPSSKRWLTSGILARGESLTLGLPEYHSAAVASSLSDILETGDLPQRFYLSAKACRGILRRAEKRGKSLPPFLRAALEQAAQQEQPARQDS